MATIAQESEIPAVSPYILTLREALKDGIGPRKAHFALGDLDVEIRAGADLLWTSIRRDGRGGLALRATSDDRIDFTCPPMGVSS
jgi:hypothetical protein